MSQAQIRILTVDDHPASGDRWIRHGTASGNSKGGRRPGDAALQGEVPRPNLVDRRIHDELENDDVKIPPASARRSASTGPIRCRWST